MKEPRGLQKGNATTLVLAVLKDGSRHGYDIAREVERRSDNAINFNHGTLYPVLHGLERDGLIASEWEQPDGERRRRIYALTEGGQAELEKCLSEWDNYALAINKVLRGAAGERA
jgi:PadR family transcriptional regulator PadR